MPDIDLDFADTRRNEVFGYLEENTEKTASPKSSLSGQ